MNDNPTNNIILSPNLSSINDAVELCVVMPAYNEEAVIKNNLLEASRIISSFASSYRIIAVNDGSKDNTHKEMTEAAQQDNHISFISYSPNRGKGGAIAAGVEYANAKYIAFLDSDLELSPSMLKDFMQALEAKDADVAIGSKLHPDSQLEYPAMRRFLSMGYYIFLKILFRLKLKDTQTGIKLFKGDIIKPICAGLATNGFAFDIEILAKISKSGYKIIEMPIKLCFNRDRTEKSRFSFKVVLNIFKETLKVKKAVKHYK